MRVILTKILDIVIFQYHIFFLIKINILVILKKKKKNDLKEK